MIKAVIIDDERPALKELEHHLKVYPAFEVSGMFTNPLEAIEKIKDIQPQIVFLDINMPQLRGIDAASMILDANPDTDIVFVTAYDQYAIEAFELHALDYLLKPLSTERFEKTLQRIMKKHKLEMGCSDKKLLIRCMGKFQIGWEGQSPIKWRTEKTKELFAFLLHHRNTEVPKDTLIDMLWPEYDLGKAVHQLHNGIYYIRKTLEEYGIDRSLVKIEGAYRLVLEDIQMDVMRLQDQISVGLGSMTRHLLETFVFNYTGEYFESEDWLWADMERKFLEKQYCEAVIKLSEIYIEEKNFEKAEEHLIRAFNKNPYEEGVIAMLLGLYQRTGDKAKAAKYFMEYAKLLREELGISPSDKLRKILTSI